MSETIKSDEKKETEWKEGEQNRHLADMTEAVHRSGREGNYQSFSGFVQEVLKRFTQSETTGLGAQLAYFFLLSLFPLLIFAMALLPYLPITQQDMLNIFAQFAPGETMTLIESTVSEVATGQSAGLLSIGLLGTLWSASNGMNALMRSFNHAYEVHETRPFYIARGMAVVWTIVMVLIVVVALLLPIFGQQIGEVIFAAFGMDEQFLTIWNAVRFGITPFVLLVAFTGLYAFVPNVSIRFISVLPGAIFATVGWLITSFLFAFYVGNFGNYSSTYGSVGGIIVLMIWLYLSGIIIMVGAQINATMAAKRRHRTGS
ncbi:YihY/virulence factor BrkB family protein [Jeotgalibacillus sp. R-1-5s-1]|uniref:YihY/virulence factor BrkB family protein n=1 Tax=Jeotgalibacillus sp. R-1-5s-1 TaxID=2555897 RepID=UPI001FC8E615|nr:YihY/virulence factor BrkB family protein [Jeotgalibacillus sp. R-1-5s-1]